MGTQTWLVSHTHLDHVACLPVYVARRRMMKMDPPVIYAPAYAIDDLRRLMLVVTAFATTHTIPSLGYVVWDRRNKLKEEYHGLPGERIRDLRQSGVAVTREVRMPLVAYTGDTSPAGLDGCPAVFQAKILITELSFVRPNHRREKIHKFGHIHLDDLIERADRFENEVIVCAHLSTRYTAPEVRRTVEAK